MSLKTPSLKATLIEVFSAIQGEGPYVGYRHLFIRFAGCHLSCAFCDTPSTFKPDPYCKIESEPGKRDFLSVLNPVDIDVLYTHVCHLLKGKLPPTISYTGGEPLLHYEYINQLTTLIKNVFPESLFLLETSGDLYRQLQAVIDCIDIVSMDIKLASVTGQPTEWENVERFIQIAHQKECYVKIVVGGETSLEELQKAGMVIAKINNQLPIILQPVTPFKNVQNAPSSGQILEWQEYLYTFLGNVRVIPQTHKFINQR